MGPQQSMNVYARSKGHFLGSKSDQPFDNNTMACFTLPSPGPGMYFDNASGSTLDVFFTLDAPMAPGLVSIELDLGSCLSNWKPVRWHGHGEMMSGNLNSENYCTFAGPCG